MNPTQELVREFVMAAHSVKPENIEKVKSLYNQCPALLNALYIKNTETALNAAGHSGARETAQFLVSKGAPLDIHAAAMLGLTEEVQAFLDSDPGLANAKGVHNTSALYHAALSGKTEVADLLLAKGGHEGIGRALHGAAKYGHTAMVKRLLDYGVDDLNFEDWADPPYDKKKTPLRVAVEKGYEDIATMIKEKGGAM